MSAIDAVLKLVKGGDHVIFGDNTYGGTYRLFSTHTCRITAWNLTLPTPLTSPNSKKHFKPNTKMVFVETPTNPVMTVTDLKAVSDLAHAHGAKVVCDNTFMSPYLQQPIDFGVDIVVHSTTKYLNGHSDSVGGFVALMTKRTLNGSALFKTALGRFSRRSIRFWYCAGPKRWPFGWRPMTGMAAWWRIF